MVNEENEVKAEVVSEENAEKKENGFSKWWKKTKTSVSGAFLESNLTDAWDDAHDCYGVYGYEGLSSIMNGASVYGKMENGILTVKKPDKDFPEKGLLINEETNQAYYIVKSESTMVTVEYEGKAYEREGLAISVDGDVKEVKVIKAKDKYYLVKE